MTATPTGSSLVLTGGEQSLTRGRARRAPVNNRLARPDVLDQTDAANRNTTAGGLRIGWAPGGLRIGWAPGRDASRAAPTGAARQRVGSRSGEQTRARYPLVIISNPPSPAMELAGRARTTTRPKAGPTLELSSQWSIHPGVRSRQQAGPRRDHRPGRRSEPPASSCRVPSPLPTPDPAWPGTPDEPPGPMHRGCGMSLEWVPLPRPPLPGSTTRRIRQGSTISPRSP